MFDYTISTQSDVDIFERQCLALEKNIPGLAKQRPINDVDGTQIQRYEKNGAIIAVHNDTEVDAVYVKSDIDLTPFFN